MSSIKSLTDWFFAILVFNVIDKNALAIQSALIKLYVEIIILHLSHCFCKSQGVTSSKTSFLISPGPFRLKNNPQ